MSIKDEIKDGCETRMGTSKEPRRPAGWVWSTSSATKERGTRSRGAYAGGCAGIVHSATGSKHYYIPQHPRSQNYLTGQQGFCSWRIAQISFTQKVRARQTISLVISAYSSISVPAECISLRLAMAGCFQNALAQFPDCVNYKFI